MLKRLYALKHQALEVGINMVSPLADAFETYDLIRKNGLENPQR